MTLQIDSTSIRRLHQSEDLQSMVKMSKGFWCAR
jgi:hypothetical protein